MSFFITLKDIPSTPCPWKKTHLKLYIYIFVCIYVVLYTTRYNYLSVIHLPRQLLHKSSSHCEPGDRCSTDWSWIVSVHINKTNRHQATNNMHISLKRRDLHCEEILDYLILFMSLCPRPKSELFLTETFYGLLASGFLQRENFVRLSAISLRKKVLAERIVVITSYFSNWIYIYFTQKAVSVSSTQQRCVWWADCGMEQEERWRRQVWHAVWQSVALLSVCNVYAMSASSVSVFLSPCFHLHTQKQWKAMIHSFIFFTISALFLVSFKCLTN